MKGITADGGEGGGKGNLVQGDTVRQEEIRNDRYGVWDVEPGEMLAPIEDAVAQRREGSGESELSDASALERKVADGRKGVGEGQLNQSTSVLSRAGLARVSGRSIFSLLGWGSSPVRRTARVLHLSDLVPAEGEVPRLDRLARVALGNPVVRERVAPRAAYAQVHVYSCRPRRAMEVGCSERPVDALACGCGLSRRAESTFYVYRPYRPPPLTAWVVGKKTSLFKHEKSLKVVYFPYINHRLWFLNRSQIP